MQKQNRRASALASFSTSTTGPTLSNLQVFKGVDPRLSSYPSTLNFYSTPPPYELTLDEFETFSIDRLKVLKAIETAKLRSKREDEVFKCMDAVVSEHMDLSRNTTFTKGKGQVLYDQRRKDHISHFLLRLAFCRSEELRNWFTRLECTLFKYRYLKEEPHDREAFLSLVQLEAKGISLDTMLAEHYPNDKSESEQVQNTHRMRLMNEIRAVYGLDMDAIKTATFYKVPFEQVLELVSKRAVLLRDGWAYVPESERVLLVVNCFKAKLVKGLEDTARALPRMEEDDRYAFF